MLRAACIACLCLWIATWSLIVTSSQALAASSSREHGYRNLLILGLGQVGSEVARQAAPHFDSVTGTSREQQRPEEQSSSGNVQIITCDLAEIRPLLDRTTHVLVTIPAVSEDDNRNYLNTVFDAVTNELQPYCWLGLISTTGVYGNYNGGWVTEESDCKTTPRVADTVALPPTTASLFVQYEAEWCRQAAKGSHALSIFRCAGIYGPTRSALHTIFKRGMPANSDNRSSSAPAPIAADLTNRIHEYDLARAVVASMQLHVPAASSAASTIFNLADDQPESRRIVLEYAASLLESAGVAVETRNAKEASSGRARRRRTDQKRVSNHKMKELLLSNHQLEYPTYREGLQAIVNDADSPWYGETKAGTR